jgi:hypothetical protein
MHSVCKKLASIEDPRNQSYITHKLIDILIIVMCAVLCGISNLEEIVLYSKNLSSIMF